MNVRVSAESLPQAVEISELYRLYFRDVWQVLRKLGVESASLEDAAHDVFMVAHRRWTDFEGRSSARTWLFSVARRVADRHRRTAFRRRRRRSALALAPTTEIPGPDAQLQRRQAWQLLLGFLGGLEPTQREAFVLGEIEGLSRTGMGTVLGISPNTAYSRLRAARARFAEAFPVPAHRSEVRTASSPPSHAEQRRTWLLLAAHLGAPSSVLTTLVPAVAGLAAVTGLTVALSRPAPVPQDEPRAPPLAPAPVPALLEHPQEPPARAAPAPRTRPAVHPAPREYANATVRSSPRPHRDALPWSPTNPPGPRSTISGPRWSRWRAPAEPCERRGPFKPSPYSTRATGETPAVRSRPNAR